MSLEIVKGKNIEEPIVETEKAPSTAPKIAHQILCIDEEVEVGLIQYLDSLDITLNEEMMVFEFDEDEDGREIIKMKGSRFVVVRNIPGEEVENKMVSIDPNALNVAFRFLLKAKKNPAARKLVESVKGSIQVKSRIVVNLDDKNAEEWTGVYVKPKTPEQKKVNKKVRRRK